MIKNLLDDKIIQKGDEIKDLIFQISQIPKDIKMYIRNKNTVLLFWNSEYMSKAFIG